MQNWLQQVGCETPERQAVCVQLAEALLADVCVVCANDEWMRRVEVDFARNFTFLLDDFGN